MPAEALLHPAVVGAIGLLLLNDHYLKASFPGVLTGKLSDVAGVAFFPILIVATWELNLVLSRRWRAPSAEALRVAIAVTAIGFALVKTVPSAAAGFGWGLGLAQWLLALPMRLLDGGPLPTVAPAVVIVDPTDLVALLALAVPWWVGTRRARRFRDGGPSTAAPEAGR